VGKILRFGCLGLIALVALVVVLVAVSSQNRPVQQRVGQQAAPADQPSPAKPQEVAKPTADPNRGIVFGKPVAVNPQLVAVLVTNTSDQVKSFTVKATYKQGDTILATASGAVNDIQPNQKRAATLAGVQPIPTSFESVRVDVDTMVQDAKTSPKAEAISKM
jgi:hypothetical protein